MAIIITAGEEIPQVLEEVLDVFLEELPRLPPEREPEITIELVPSIILISKPPHMMAPVELEEMRNSLKS